MQLAMVAAGFTPARPTSCAARWRRGSAKAGSSLSSDGCAKACCSERLHAGVRRARLPADPRLRRVRLSRVALGELRAARLRVGVDQVPRAGRVPRGAAQQPADGLLLAVAARAGCAPARRRSAAGRRRGERLGLHARAVHGEDGARQLAARAARLAHGQGPHRRRRSAHRRGAAATAVRRRRRSRAPRARSIARDLRTLAAAGALRSARRPSAQRALARRRRRAPTRDLLRDAPGRESLPLLASAHAKARTSSPTTASLGLTLGRHPLALLRERLTAHAACRRAEELKAVPHGQPRARQPASSPAASVRHRRTASFS